jgi:hypothetical protein
VGWKLEAAGLGPGGEQCRDIAGIRFGLGKKGAQVLGPLQRLTAGTAAFENSFRTDATGPDFQVSTFLSFSFSALSGEATKAFES